jgi:hypothetical protein
VTLIATLPQLSSNLNCTLLGNPATHLPQGLGGLPWMTSIATAKLKKSIADIGVPEVPEFLEQIVASGRHLWACRMSADMNHRTKTSTTRSRTSSAPLPSSTRPKEPNSFSSSDQPTPAEPRESSAVRHARAKQASCKPGSTAQL